LVLVHVKVAVFVELLEPAVDVRLGALGPLQALQ
jgi:hypothetical protein